MDNKQDNDKNLPRGKLDLQNKHLCMALMPLTVSRFHPNPNKHNTLAQEFAFYFAHTFKTKKMAAIPSGQPDVRLRTPDDLREGLQSLQALSRLAKNLEDAMSAVSRLITVMEGAVKESQIERHAYPSSKWPFPDEVHDMIFKFAITCPYDVFIIGQVSREFRRIVKKYHEWSKGLSSGDISCRGNTKRLKYYLTMNLDAPITAMVNTHDFHCNSFLAILIDHHLRFEKIRIIGRNDRNLDALSFEGYDLPRLRTLYLYDTPCVGRFRCWRMPHLADLALIATPLTADVLNGTYPDALKCLTIESPKADVNSALPERIHDFLRRAQVRSINTFSFRVDFSVRVGQTFHQSPRPLVGATLKSLTFLHLMFAFGSAGHFNLCARLVGKIIAPNLSTLHASIVFGNETAPGSIEQADVQSLFFNGTPLPKLQELRLYVETRSIVGLRDHDSVDWQLAPIVAVYTNLRIFSLHTNIGSSVQTPLYNLKNLKDVQLAGAHFDHRENQEHFLSDVDPDRLMSGCRKFT